jgi:hypothetical protein
MSHHPDHEPDTAAIGRAIQAAARKVQAPPDLRTRVEAQRERAGGTRRGRARQWAGRRPAIALGVATAVVALALAITGLPGGEPGTPSLDQAAALTLSPPTQPAPAVDANDSSSVKARVDGVAFPNYQSVWKTWRTAGARYDELGKRDARTVVYRGPAGDVGYTIVAGAPLRVPAGARRMTVDGVRLAVLRHDGATVVTWQRGGHTCIVAGRRVDADQLVRFATWA